MSQDEFDVCMGYREYNSQSGVHASIPAALPVPNCRCGVPAKVKQSRHQKTARRSYYVCRFKFVRESGCHNNLPIHFFFFQWIDGHDKFNPRIWLFPYLLSPQNAAPMTVKKILESARKRLRHPPMCNGLRHEVVATPRGLTICLLCPFSSSSSCDVCSS